MTPASGAGRSMSAPKIKFCGLTREVDVRAAIDLGIDAIGLNLARGPRRLELAHAAELARLLPPFITAVALLIDADEATILEAMRVTRCTTIQLHGSEPPELAERLRARFPVIKAFSVTTAASLAAVRGYPADAYLLDAAAAGAGGSGLAWDHGLASAESFDRPVILAGGLRPDTVAAAVAQVRPWAVDVSSGIESAPGIKERTKMAAFVLAINAGASPLRP
ncbi:MAG: phosphoribosylanthranilate isomerase [Planctomycetes bacterium]|nr:phosphoribosylanthranilate isomerase [Planctomycetota bacterium]